MLDLGVRWNTGAARFRASGLLLRGDRAEPAVHLGEQHDQAALLRRQLRRPLPIRRVHAPGAATTTGGTLRSPSSVVPSPQRSINHPRVSCKHTHTHTHTHTHYIQSQRFLLTLVLYHLS